MSARLSLLCHAATEATRLARFPLDEPIEAKEWTRLAQGEWLPKGRIDYVLASPALRAWQTASGLGIACGRAGRMETAAALADIDYGRWAGRSMAACAEQEPEAIRAWMQDPAAAPHGGESLHALLARAGPWLEEDAMRQGRVIAITHAAVMRAVILLTLGAPAEAFWKIDVAPLTRVDLSHDGRGWRLRAIQPG